MSAEILSLVILGLIFLVGTWKSIHLGILALVGAFAVGTLVAGQSYSDVMDGFPVSILVLLLGITYLFAIARESGVIDWMVQKAIVLVGGHVLAIPWVFFLLAVLLGAMGSSLTSLALAPIAMTFAGRHRLHPMLMALTIMLGGGAGGFAPTSLFGVVTNGVAADNGIEPQPLLLFAAAFGFNLVLFAAAYVFFGTRRRVNLANTPLDGDGGAAGGPAPTHPGGNGGGGTAVLTHTRTEVENPVAKLTRYQIVCLSAIVSLIVLVTVFTVVDLPFDVGVLALTLALVVSLFYPSRTRSAIKGVDWSTILLVGGVLTYVGVMQAMGTVELLGNAAESIGSPLLAALTLCIVAAFVSAFASTTGLLGALIPLAVPLIGVGGLPAFGLIMALAISSNLVDSTPFSSPGATCIANAEEAQRGTLTKMMLRWGFSMILIGPIMTVTVLVLPGM